MSGQKWTRFTLVAMLLVSISANVGHTLLAQSAIPTWLRMTGAVIWPLIVFLAIEVLVRTDWGVGFIHGAIRAVILAPAIPAAITSYEHMHAVLLSMGERPFIAAIGPGAVDLLMIGCTLALLLAYRKSAPSVDEVLERWSVAEDAPISPAPLTFPETIRSVMEQEMDLSERRSAAEGIQTERVRTVIRRPSWDARMVAEMILSGAKPAEIEEKTGAKPASIGRFRKVARMIQEDPRVTIDPKKEKVTSDNIRMIRELVTR